MGVMFVIQRLQEQGYESETRTDTVVLIHGLWMTPLSWEHWVTRYEQRGMRVITPGYPGVQPGTAGVEALRRDPSPLVNLGVREIFDHWRTIAALDTKPIIMGHSFGGAFAQLLLDAGYGSAGVSIDGAGVKGVWALPFSQIKAAFPVLRNPANLHRAVPITEHEFHYAFTNNLSLEESKKVYDRYAVPCRGGSCFRRVRERQRMPRRYNFANDDRAPLLFIAGGNDICRRPYSAKFRKECEGSVRSRRTSCSTAAATTCGERLGGGCRLRARLGAGACGRDLGKG